MEDRISGLADKLDIKEKTEFLDKRLKSCKSNIQTCKLWALSIHNIFNKIMAENFPNFEKDMPIHVQEVSRTPNRHDQNRTS
jgi:hypothetical protein